MRVLLAVLVTALVVAMPAWAVGDAQTACGGCGTQAKQGPPGPRGKKGKQGKRGPRGFRGPEGPEGPEGPAGSDGSDGIDGQDGGPGADGVSGYTVETNNPEPNTNVFKAVQVNCPAGLVPLGGGAEVVVASPSTQHEVLLSGSNLTDAGNGWIAFAEANDNVDFPWSLNVTVICADVN